MTPTDERPQPTVSSRAPLRRRPQLRPFLVLGALIGFVVGAITALLGPDAPSSSAGQEVVLLGATGALLGGFVAAMIYLVLDRASLRR